MIRNWLLVLTTAALLMGCLEVTCDKDDPEAVAARVLSKERLERLYTDAESLARDNPDVHLWGGQSVPLPDQFKDIGPVRVERGFDHSVILRLRGCLDHHLDLAVASIGTADARIELRYGEGPSSGTEVLWRRADG